MSHEIPFDFSEAVDASRQCQRAQIDAEQALRDTSAEWADAEKSYRKALARKIVEVHADGAAWTVAQDLARGDDHVAELRYKRDVTRGVYEATQTSSWRHTANRKDCLELIVWSRNVAPDGQYEPMARAA